MEVDGSTVNTEQLENLFMKKRVMFSLRLAEVAVGQVVYLYCVFIFYAREIKLLNDDEDKKSIFI